MTTSSLSPLSGAVWRSGGLRDRYPVYLREMHGVLRASVPLMKTAVARCADHAADPIAAQLAGYLVSHISEETDHDTWLLDDFALTGGDPEWLHHRQPSLAVARLAGCQYYWINHYHPVCLVGYIAVLEAAAPPHWLPDLLMVETGFTAEVFRTLRHHAVVDEDHSAAVVDLLCRMQLTAAQQAAVRSSILATAEAFGEVLAGIARHPSSLPPSASPFSASASLPPPPPAFEGTCHD